jgi:hypothetical protein
LLHLAALDSDHAQVRNDVGFNRFDNAFGHSLAAQLYDTDRLTDKQWLSAIRIAMHYPKQVGRPTEEA